MSLIDHALALSLGLPVHQTTRPIPVRGIGSSYISSSYVKLPVFFRGESVAAKLLIEAYIVEKLNA